MRLFAFVITLFITSFNYAQDYEKINGNDSLFHTIKGESIRSIPATNFLDAVNGMFPWVFSQYSNNNDFLFIVDGFAIQDINAISLYDIQEIEFSKKGSQGLNFPLTRLGTFFIKTKKSSSSNNKFQFNSQYCISTNQTIPQLNKGNIYPTYYEQMSRANLNKSGKLITNQLGYSLDKKRLRLNASIQIQSIANPEIYQELSFANISVLPNRIDSIKFTRKATQNNFRGLLNLEYDILKNLQINFKINHYNSKDIVDTSIIDTASSFTGSKYISKTQQTVVESKYTNMATQIKWKPFNGFQNETSVEYFSGNIDYANLYSYIDSSYPNNKGFSNRSISSKISMLRISNKSKYELIHSSGFIMDIAAVLSHNIFKNDYYDSVYYSSGITLRKSYYDYKLTTFSPTIDFKVKQFLYGYVGYPFFLSDIKNEISSSSKSNPFLGFVFDIKKVLKLSDRYSAVKLNFDYTDMPISQQPNHQLGTLLNSSDVYSSSIYNSSFDYTTKTYDLFKIKTFSIQIVSKFNKSNTVLGLDYNTQLMDRYYQLQSSGGFTSITMVRGQQFTSGISCFAQFDIINKTKFKWNSRFSMLLPKVEFKSIFDNSILEKPVNYDLQSALQNKISINYFVIQANINVGINKKYYEPESQSNKLIQKKMDEIGISYLSCGYDFSHSQNKYLKNFEIVLQARNILTSKEFSEFYQLNKYFGLKVEYAF